MTNLEFRAAIEHLGLSQIGAARLFGVDPRTSRRWALGELQVPRSISLCLRLMLKHKVSVSEVEAMLREIDGE